MSETKFTKGEWSQSHRKDENTGMYSTEVYDSRGQTICTLAWHTEPDCTRTDRPENASLIAAAPDMYAMLNTINESIIHCDNEIGLADDITNLCHDIDQLLKSARG